MPNKEENKGPAPRVSAETNIDPQEMLQSGLHFGHRVSSSHPKMKPYLFGVRNTIQIIDLEKSAEKLREALAFIKTLIEKGGVLLFVGTKIQTKEMTRETAQACGLPYVNVRWLGGTFTNFETIKKRVSHLKDLEKQKAEGELEKYTKKERLKIEKEINDLEKRLGGIKEMEKLPEAIFVCDIKKDELAGKEARAKGVEIVAISDTNTDPSLVGYPIPANDDAASSVRYILDKVKETILSAKKK